MNMSIAGCSDTGKQDMRFPNAEPFVRWKGGKSYLLPVLTGLLPDEPIHTYCEPFIGSGALLFHLQPEVAYINDINGELINAYQVIRNEPDKLISILSQCENTAEFYHQIRSLDRDMTRYNAMPPEERAARFIYLNKTSCNRLYRVNQKGEFNAPYGNFKDPNIVNTTVIHGIRDYLNHAQIYFTQMDFQEVLQNIPNNTFVYLDPPHLPDIEKPSFTQHRKYDFSLYDHMRLHGCCDELTRRGIRFMLSNSYTPIVTSLYAKYSITPVQARGVYNYNSVGYGEIAEVVVRNYI